MEKLILIIGGNLGDRLSLIQKAKKRLEESIGTCIQTSSIFETEAWGGKSSGNYLNQVLVYETEKNPAHVLRHIGQIEIVCGRERNEKWGDRTMDIDILYFGEKIINTADLQIPHPFIAERKFVLTPLTEIMPDFVHPVLEKTHFQLLEACKDNSKVEKYQKSPA